MMRPQALIDESSAYADPTSFADHVIKQITGRLATRTNCEPRYAQLMTAQQFIFDVGAAAVYANLSKQDSYDKIADLRRHVANGDGIAAAKEVIALSKWFKERLSQYDNTSAIKKVIH